MVVMVMTRTIKPKSCVNEKQPWGESWGEVHPHMKAVGCNPNEKRMNIVEANIQCALNHPVQWSLPNRSPSFQPTQPEHGETGRIRFLCPLLKFRLVRFALNSSRLGPIGLCHMFKENPSFF